MKCHGLPQKAPKDLVKKYGLKAGFYEKIGSIRALLCITYPIESEADDAIKKFWILTSWTILVFILLLIVIYILIHQDQILQKQIQDAIKENEKQLHILQQQNKLASMGEMIGAIAHQWRQPLNVINTSIQNLKYDFKEGKLKDEQYIQEFINKNKKIIKFMSKTIDDFRSFFRVDKKKTIFKVKEATTEVVNMQLAQLQNYNIDIVFEGEEFEINGYKREYQQVVLNLINNAKDILIQKRIKKPLITIKLRQNRVCIEDNGGGVKQDIIDRIFEPYFTTKEQGKGTGMGLYMSKMIIEDNMGGKLSVKNGALGAIFCIEFKNIK
jgi:signal transduction histidine kinase